jgi:hypothetical protein
VPAGQSLTINLTNNLTFTPTGATTATTVPTSIVIVGQIGGGLGTANAACPGGGTTCDASPTHVTNAVTWSTVSSATFTAPAQLPRARSLGTEVAVGTTATALTWTTPRAGTYLLESGTHPSVQAAMGLVGMLVVTTPPTAAVEQPRPLPGAPTVTWPPWQLHPRPPQHRDRVRCPTTPKSRCCSVRLTLSRTTK